MNTALISQIGNFVLDALSVELSEVVPGELSIKPVSPQGNLNYTFELSSKLSPNQSFILKVKDQSEFEHPISKILADSCRLEQLALRLADDTPTPTAVGMVWSIEQKFKDSGPFAVRLETKLPGISGAVLIEGLSSKSSRAKELELLKLIGAAARKISAAEVTGFGNQLSKDASGFALSWNEYIEKLFPFSKKDYDKFVSSKTRENFFPRLAELKQLLPEPRLIHADLHLANALFLKDSHKLSGIIDWEKARGSIAQEEFARILYWNFILEQKFKSFDEIDYFFKQCGGLTDVLKAFLEGYEIPVLEYQSRYQKLTETFLLLFCANFIIRWNTDWKKTRPDWENPAKYAGFVIESICSNAG